MLSPSQLQQYYEQFRLLRPLLAGLEGEGSHKFLDTIRGFRDVVLAQSAAGRELTKRYYDQGPAIMRLLAENPELAAQSLSVVVACLPSIEAAVAATDGEPRLDRSIYQRGQKLRRKYRNVARGKIRDDLLKLEHFLARRGELKGEAVVFDLTDPSVLVKPVAVRPLPSKGRGVQADVGAE